MISLTRPYDDVLPPAGPGAFSWWYLDLVDEKGDGLVLIWGFALPFLSPPPDARAVQHPVLNVAVYEGGVTTCYHLEELAPADISLDGDGWRFGRSRLSSRQRGDRWVVRADLDLPVAGTRDRLRGEVVVEGPVVDHAWDEAGPHRWAPLTLVAEGQARLEREGGGGSPGWRTEIRGRAYHDRNTGQIPLHRMGIGEWAWGHVALPDAELVHYLLWPEAGSDGRRVSNPQVLTPRVLTLRADAAGRTEIVEGGAVHGRGAVGGFWGLPAPRELQLPGQGALRAGVPVDQSPFYLRFPMEARDGSGSVIGRGWGERVRPGAFDLWWMRRFVRMRVMAPQGNSPWLPAFSGPRADRVQRLFGGVYP